jgi:glycosyltransferase involved in cell wall biosynthesis
MNETTANDLLLLSVVLCTHNPRRDFLERTLSALRVQTLALEAWELILIDNASSPSLTEWLNLTWHPNARILHEEQLGLTHARLTAAREAKSDVLVFSDDDTLLDPNYLALAMKELERLPKLGVAGGPSLPEYEACPADWFSPELAPLGCRDLGPAVQTANWREGQRQCYPACAPIGAGMVIRREVFSAWAALTQSNPIRQALGRKGMALSSGEDNDINLVALANGWDIAYLPQLRLTHLLPARRLDAGYLERLAFASSRDWVRVLALHGVCPWSPIHPWTTPLRKLKAWFAYRAWAGAAARIRWRGACGHFEGRAAIRSS